MTMAAKDTSGTIPYTTIDNISNFNIPGTKLTVEGSKVKTTSCAPQSVELYTGLTIHFLSFVTGHNTLNGSTFGFPLQIRVGFLDTNQCHNHSKYRNEKLYNQPAHLGDVICIDDLRSATSREFYLGPSSGPFVGVENRNVDTVDPER